MYEKLGTWPQTNELIKEVVIQVGSESFARTSRFPSWGRKCLNLAVAVRIVNHNCVSRSSSLLGAERKAGSQLLVRSGRRCSGASSFGR